MKPRLEILFHDDKLALAWLEQFKQYASVPDNSRDALLRELLLTALLRVQEYADKALLECRVRQTGQSTAETGHFRLYLGGGNILAVSYDYGGEEAPYAQIAANLLTVSPRGSVVTVEFTTAPSESWRAQARTTVFRYATALYDGEPVEVLNSILNEVL